MAEPTSARTIGDLVKEVAIYAGLAGYGTTGTAIATVPTDGHDLDLCRRIVNNAIRKFIAHAPDSGWHWQKRIMSVPLQVSLTGTATSGTTTTLVDSGLATTYSDDTYNNFIIEITAGTGRGETALVTDYTGASGTFTFSALSNGSTPDTTSEYAIGSRYKLADDFGGDPSGFIKYIRDSNRGTPIEWSSEGGIRGLRENFAYSGYPRYASIRPYGHRQFEIVLWPDPTTADMLEFPYTLFFDEIEIESGVATAGTATSLSDSGRGEANNYFSGWTLTVVAGTAIGQTATVTTYTGATGKFDFTALSGSGTPDTTSVYIVEPAVRTHPAGHRFDDVLISACKAQAELDIDDLAAKWADIYLNIDLPKAYSIDARQRPRKLGPMRENPSESRGFGRVWQDVTYN